MFELLLAVIIKEFFQFSAFLRISTAIIFPNLYQNNCERNTALGLHVIGLQNRLLVH